MKIIFRVVWHGGLLTGMYTLVKELLDKEFIEEYQAVDAIEEVLTNTKIQKIEDVGSFTIEKHYKKSDTK